MNYHSDYDRFKAELSSEPENGELWLRYARCLRDTVDEPIETLNAFETAQRLLPNKDLRLHIGRALFWADRSEEGISLLKKCTSEKPTAHGYCILANALLKIDNYDEAYDFLILARSCDPDFEEVYYLLGEAVRHKSHLAAIGFYEEALRRDPEYQLAWQALGSLLIAAQVDLVRGIQALNRAIELNPKDCWATMYLGDALWRMGRIEEADKLFKSAIKLCPDSQYLVKFYVDFLKFTGRSNTLNVDIHKLIE